jgi:ABC-type Mn2+/Zn2+ transport system permease subunit
MNGFLEIFGVDFMRHALVAGLLVGAMCGYVGVYIVLRRIVFVGASLAQIASSGFAVGMLMGWNPFLSAVAITLMGTLLFAVHRRAGRVPQDSILALGYTVAAAGTILLLAKHPKGDSDLMTLLFGNILTIGVDQIYLLTGTCIVVGGLHLLFYKEFVFMSFDPEMAETLGYRPQAWNILFYISLGIVISLAVKSAGILLVFGSLVLPPVAALLLSQRMKWVFTCSVLVAVGTVPIGLYLSFVADFPSGPTILALQAGILAAVSPLRAIRKS